MPVRLSPSILLLPPAPACRAAALVRRSALDAFHSQPFHIAQMRDKFTAQAQSDLTSTYSDSAMAQDPSNPTLLAEEIAAEVDFFKKIKFKYREQEAKESFLKLILADHPEQIDQAENEAVGAWRRWQAKAGRSEVPAG